MASAGLDSLERERESNTDRGECILRRLLSQVGYAVLNPVSASPWHGIRGMQKVVYMYDDACMMYSTAVRRCSSSTPPKWRADKVRRMHNRVKYLHDHATQTQQAR